MPVHTCALRLLTTICVAALIISIYPGLLSDLLLFAVLVGVLVAPIALIVLAIRVQIGCSRGHIRFDRTPSDAVVVLLAMLVVTYAALRLYVPRRIAFACCRSSFQQIVDNGVKVDAEINRRIGPYFIDECLVDERGGTYFRVYSGADGIGPDIMSYGFCYNPNDDGSPFGAAYYRTFRLGDGWYWFRASNDWY